MSTPLIISFSQEEGPAWTRLFSYPWAPGCPGPVAPAAPLALLFQLRASPRKLGFVYYAPIYFIFSLKYKKYVGYSNIICSLLINNTADGMKLGCKLKVLRKAKIW